MATFYILQETGGPTDRLLAENGVDLLITEEGGAAVVTPHIIGGGFGGDEQVIGG